MQCERDIYGLESTLTCLCPLLLLILISLGIDDALPFPVKSKLIKHLNPPRYMYVRYIQNAIKYLEGVPTCMGILQLLFMSIVCLGSIVHFHLHRDFFLQGVQPLCYKCTMGPQSELFTNLCHVCSPPYLKAYSQFTPNDFCEAVGRDTYYYPDLRAIYLGLHPPFQKEISEVSEENVHLKD